MHKYLHPQLYPDQSSLSNGQSGRLDGRYCTSNRPAEFHSEGNTLVLKYVTDGSGQGFVASYSTVEGG